MPASKDEFAVIQGEYQQRGSPRPIMALARSAEVPGNPADAPLIDLDDRQVTSMFVTRPIGAYDFVLSGDGATDPNGATLSEPFMPAPQAGLASNMLSITFPLPVGFVAVVHRVEMTILPAHNGGIDNALEISFQRSASALPSNRIRLYGIVGDYAWDTHQVFGYWETPGLVMTAHDGIGHRVGARILGTLIPARNASPLREIGSLPIAVRK